MESLHLVKLVISLITATHLFQNVSAGSNCQLTNCDGSEVPYPCPGHPNLVCMPDGVCRVCCCNETSQCSYIGDTEQTRCNCPDGATGKHCFCPIPDFEDYWDESRCGCKDAYGLLKACVHMSSNFERTHRKKVDVDWAANTYSAFNFTMTPTVETVDDCRRECTENPLCRVFNFKVSNRHENDIICQCFTPESIVNNNVRINANDDWEVFARECVLC